MDSVDKALIANKVFQNDLSETFGHVDKKIHEDIKLFLFKVITFIRRYSNTKKIESFTTVHKRMMKIFEKKGETKEVYGNIKYTFGCIQDKKTMKQIITKPSNVWWLAIYFFIDINVPFEEMSSDSLDSLTLDSDKIKNQDALKLLYNQITDMKVDFLKTMYNTSCNNNALTQKMISSLAEALNSVRYRYFKGERYAIISKLMKEGDIFKNYK
jgi:hypothetical protein